jgi:hypothetical protein
LVAKVDGGMFHLINSGMEGNPADDYTVPFNSSAAGGPGKISELIGCFAWTGVTNTSANAGNPVSQWGNFDINKWAPQTMYNVTQPKLGPAAGPPNVTLTWINRQGAFNLMATRAFCPGPDGRR